jgi:general L-amino acid transport system permease protein
MTTAPTPAPSTRPAVVQQTPIAWLKKNLFNNWYNSLISILLLWLIASTLYSTVVWAFTAARWAVIPENLKLFMTGLFPVDQLWRIWLLVGLISALAGLTWGALARNAAKLFGWQVLVGAGAIALLLVLVPTPLPNRLLLLGLELLVLAMAWMGRAIAQRVSGFAKWLPLAWGAASLVGLWLLVGGLGLATVSTNQWGGLLLTLFMAVVSIVVSFPIGIGLALSRQSKLPVVKGMAVTLIEMMRGTPLTVFLFIGDVMLPIFLPNTVSLDRILRAMVVLILFCGVYTAETLRGGLQAIPRGQTEAANALGLNTPLTLGLVVLPQAIKISIPALVGVFIQMIQETSLIAILGLFDLLGMSRSILSNPNFVGRYAEVYFFIGLIYWSLCYVMSIGSRRLEQALNTEH